jgi:hypothetical protein
MELKYCIQAYLDDLSRQEHHEIMTHILRGIAPSRRSTFFRWRKIKRCEVREIPLSKQRIIARALKCSIDDLINY